MAHCSGAQGKWKLGGFNFAAHANYKPGSGQTMQLGEFNSKPGFRTGPSLDYIAPEFIFVKCFDYISDLFSLGMLNAQASIFPIAHVADAAAAA